MSEVISKKYWSICQWIIMFAMNDYFKTITYRNMADKNMADMVKLNIETLEILTIAWKIPD